MSSAALPLLPHDENFTSTARGFTVAPRGVPGGLTDPREEGLNTHSTGADLLARTAALADRWRARADRAGDGEVFPSAALRELADHGLLAAPLASREGGLGFGVESGKILPLFELLRHVGRGDLVAGRIFEGHVNALNLLQTFGTSEQVAQFGADARDAHRLFGVWNAEIPAEAVRLHPAGRGRWRLEGAKIFASGAGHVERPFVNGQLPGGAIQMCVVPMEQVGVEMDPSWWQPMGMRGTASYRVDFTGVELGPEHLIGGPGDYYREPGFNGGSVRFAAVQLGGAEALYDATRRYLARLGRTADVFQQMRAVEMAVAVESGRLWLRGAAEMWERGGTNSEALLAYVAMVRTVVEGICTQVINLVERSVGARGLMWPEPFERMVRDLSMYLRQPAPDAAAARVGRYVLESHPRTPAYAQWHPAGGGAVLWKSSNGEQG